MGESHASGGLGNIDAGGGLGCVYLAGEERVVVAGERIVVVVVIVDDNESGLGCWYIFYCSFSFLPIK